MNDKEMFDAIIKAISSYVKDKNLLETVTPETQLIQDLEINSARLLDIIITIEDAFDIEINDDDLDRIKTIGQLMEVIRGKKVTSAT